MKSTRLKRNKRDEIPRRTYSAAWLGAVLAVLVLVVYSNSLDGGFHFDDQALFLDSHVVSPGFGWSILRPMQTRPLTYLSFHWNVLGAGREPWSFHVVNVLLHGINSVVVMLVALRVLPRWAAWFAAALFAVHPLQTQAVNYIFERATLLATCFALCSFYLFLLRKHWWSALFFGFSLLAKEETVALPLFLLAYEFFHRKNRIEWRYYASMAALAGLAAVRLFYVAHSLSDPTIGFKTAGVSAVEYALTQSRVIWLYVRLYVVPSGLNVDHDIRLSRGLLDPPSTLIGLIVLLGAIAVLVGAVRRKYEAALWALGFFILLAPSSSIVPVKDLAFEHRMYFPLVCLTIATGSALGHLSSRWRAPVAAVVLVPLAVATVMRNEVWHDDRSLWADAVQKSPGKARPHFQLAQTHVRSDPALARRLYEQGLALEPLNSDGWMNLGLLFLSSGDSDTALAHLRKALDLSGGQAVVWNNIGAAHLQRGEIPEGIAALRKALAAQPCRFDSRMNLVKALTHINDVSAARAAAMIPPECRLLPEQVRALSGVSAD